MAPTASKVDLAAFTFDSLYFCETPVELLRGTRFLVAVNEWYMPFIRTGWAVPLAFIVDVSTMLLQPGTAFRNRWKENPPEQIRKLSLDYFRMLQGLRRQPIFEAVVKLIEQTSDESRRNQTVKVFLRFLLAELSRFRNTYAFNTRELKVEAARPSRGCIDRLSFVVGGNRRQGRLVLDYAQRGQRKNEFGTLLDLMQAITEHYSAHLLQEFISDEEWLLVEIAARSPSGIGRVDYRFLQELLHPQDLSSGDEVEPRPRLVERVIPTESYEQDGPVGGYIDVNQRRFTGAVAELLPAEMSLFRHRSVMYQKLLNEGALHFVRENIECIEEELRVLFCFVLDNDPRMMRCPTNTHSSFGGGMSPYVRARAVAARMIKELARRLPRRHVHVDFALYLWSAEAKNVYRVEFDLFNAWSREAAADRFRFAVGLVEQTPHLFYYRAGPEAAQENRSLDPDPAQYIIRRSQSRLYHCRHLVFLTSSRTASQAFPDRDAGLLAANSTGDSIFVVYCDVHKALLTVCRAPTLSTARDGRSSLVSWELSEERLREKFVETVFWKGAGKIPPPEVSDTLGDLS